MTCGPDEFHARNYTLRPTLYNRQTELFIVVTMYNENEELFCRTLHGIMSEFSSARMKALILLTLSLLLCRKHFAPLQTEEEPNVGS